jgi:hypothetical protein
LFCRGATIKEFKLHIIVESFKALTPALLLSTAFPSQHIQHCALCLLNYLGKQANPLTTLNLNQFSVFYTCAMAKTQAQIRLEKEDHERDLQFKKAMHGKSADAKGGFAAMMGKDTKAQGAAVDEYFKHWNTKAAAETEEDREVRSSSS